MYSLKHMPETMLAPRYFWLLFSHAKIGAHYFWVVNRHLHFGVNTLFRLNFSYFFGENGSAHAFEGWLKVSGIAN